jgi:hypothetical protein
MWRCVVAYDPLGPLLPKWVSAISKHMTKTCKRVTVQPGSNQPTWDDCCDGLLVIRVVSVVGSPALSVPATQPCYPVYQVRLGVMAVRCAHTVDDQGVAPTPGEMTADALQTLQDRADITEGILCEIAPEIADWSDGGTLRIEQWLPTIVQGGCVGGEVTFTFNQALCTPCPE